MAAETSFSECLAFVIEKMEAAAAAAEASGSLSERNMVMHFSDAVADFQLAFDRRYMLPRSYESEEEEMDDDDEDADAEQEGEGSDDDDEDWVDDESEESGSWSAADSDNGECAVSVVKEGAETCGEACSICLATYAAGKTVARLFCKHTFHKPCISQWFMVRKCCPLCKEDL